MKETFLKKNFSHGTVRVLCIYSVLIQYQHKMTKNNSANAKFPDSQHGKSKPTIKNVTGVTLNLLSHMIGDTNGEINFPY